MWTRLALAILSLAPFAVTQQLTDASFARWRDYVLPSADELRWAEIPWRPSLRDGVLEANDLDEPVLLWAMNGHPLGCT